MARKVNLKPKEQGVIVSVRLNPSLLEAVDREAKARGLSRSRVVVASLERLLKNLEPVPTI